MANHASHASLPYPVKNARFTIPVTYRASDGTPTDPTTPDTEISKDGAAFADCAEEVTTISGTATGVGYITLSGAETNCSFAVVVAKAASGPLSTQIVLKPRLLPILEADTAQAGAAGSITLAADAAAYDLAGCIVRTTGGTGGGGTGGADNQARLITAYNTSTKVATVVPDWETNPSSDTTYDILYTELASNAIKGMVGIDWGNILNTDASVAFTETTVKETTTASSVTTVGTGAITSASLATSAVTKVRSIVTGTADSGTTSTVVDAERTEGDTDYWKGKWILFTSGTISGQCRLITGFTPGTDTITFTPVTTQAVGTNTYEILPAAGADLRLSLGEAVTNSDFTIASADASSVTLPTTYTDGTSLPDDDRYINCVLQVVGGTGFGQVVLLTTAGASARQYNVSSGTMPVQLDNTSACVVVGTWNSAGSGATAADIADAVWDEDATGHQTAGTFGQAIGDPGANTETIYDAVVTDAAGTNVAADIIAVKAETASILTDTGEIGTAGAGLSAIPWNATWDAQVESEVTDALNAYDPPTKAELDAAVANVSVDEIQATALADLFNTDSGTTYASAVAGSVVTEIANNSGGSALTEGGIADAVWDEARSGHVAAGSFGEGVVVNSIANNAITANAIASDAIAAAKIAAGAITAAKFASGAIDATALAADAANEIADALLDRSAGVETNRTVRQALRLMLAALVGKLSGAATTSIAIRDTNDGVDRIVATVDSSGNRSAVTLDAG